MKASAKAKWIVSVSGVAFSAFIIGQLDDTNVNKDDPFAIVANSSLSDREKELLNLDWSDFTLQAVDERNVQSDRTSRRSKRD